LKQSPLKLLKPEEDLQMEKPIVLLNSEACRLPPEGGAGRQIQGEVDTNSPRLGFASREIRT